MRTSTSGARRAWDRRERCARRSVAQRLAPLYHAASYRRIFELGPAAVAELGNVLAWLLGMLVEDA